MKKHTFKILVITIMSGLIYSCTPESTSAIEGLPDAEVNNDPPGAPPRGFVENYQSHDHAVRRQYFDDYVGVYYDTVVDRSITWPFNFFSSAWNEVTDIYGDFGNESALYVVGHGESSEGIYTTVFDQQDSHSLIDFTVPADSTGAVLDEPLRLMADVVQMSANGVFKSPAKAVWKDKFSQIFIFDLYRKLGMDNEASRVKQEYLNDVDDFPNPGTQWFKDWFLPIYETYNGANTVSNFFEVLSQNYPIDGSEYSKDMNMGEFIHFWSAATGEDLLPMAEAAFEWNDGYNDELLQARAEFPNLNYPFEPASELIDLTSEATVSVSKDNDGGAEANEGSLKLIDNDVNSKFLTGGFPQDFWMQQNFTDAKVANKYTITSGNDAPDRDMKSWELLGSNDGITWEVIDTRTDQSWTERNQTREYNFDNSNAYLYYRINVLDNNGSSLIQVSEWRLLNLQLLDFGPKDFTENAILSVNQENGSGPDGPEGSLKLIDNDVNTKFFLGGYTSEFYAQQELPEAKIITKYTLTSGNDSPERDPKNWEILGSNNGESWVVLDTREEQTFSERNQTKEFLVDNETAYKYYRFHVTAISSGGAMQLSEWRILGIE
ncbi:hypothetical protein APR41_14000 [Salegentibacter salinarum]|uniref:F5/8 type C domain-containing protein n=1 Tax=Salegentibacter salinarum TaxID=447422 RepID=A0A2N0U077_9FLAO|nr:discoidin domain-containing protein [Salegentibacter salinarum]PKD20387.1 hypothetical protein APR41_14000 [Salegentibacter salinarum]SKB85318.1 F5/8 type C domain-containing protein [Salegentibacter salinarum]